MTGGQINQSIPRVPIKSALNGPKQNTESDKKQPQIFKMFLRQMENHKRKEKKTKVALFPIRLTASRNKGSKQRRKMKYF